MKDSIKSIFCIFQRVDTIYARIESIILILTLMTMILMGFLQVILRNFFASGILWGDIFLRHLVLWIGFLGASLATRENRHIKIDALSRSLNPIWRERLFRLTNLFSAVICGLLVRAACVFILDERAAGTTLFLGIPLWLFVSIIVISLVSMTFRFFMDVFNSYHVNSEDGEGK